MHMSCKLRFHPAAGAAAPARALTLYSYFVIPRPTDPRCGPCHSRHGPCDGAARPPAPPAQPPAPCFRSSVAVHCITVYAHASVQHRNIASPPHPTRCS